MGKGSKRRSMDVARETFEANYMLALSVCCPKCGVRVPLKYDESAKHCAYCGEVRETNAK